MNKEEIKYFIDLLETDTPVWSISGGLIVECTALELRMKPLKYIMKIKDGGNFVSDTYYTTEPTEVIPKKGSMVERIDGSFVKSSGKNDSNGDLLDESGKAWSDTIKIEKVKEVKESTPKS